jgi:uncharacterized protein (TIGR03085 family)
MGRARNERAELADLLVEVGPDHPTLCAGWTAYDLVAHLVTRERAPWSGPGLMIPPLHGITERAERATKRRHTFSDLVETFRAGPPRWHPSRFGPVDDAMNLVELFVHIEDVRRGSAAAEPRELEPALSATLWKALRRFARLSLRRVPVGVVVERTDEAGQFVARKGEPAVTLAGPAAELLLYSYGRRTAARVEIRGDPAAVETLSAAPVGI